MILPVTRLIKIASKIRISSKLTYPFYGILIELNYHFTLCTVKIPPPEGELATGQVDRIEPRHIYSLEVQNTSIVFQENHYLPGAINT
jgi:hypothetical protein